MTDCVGDRLLSLCSPAERLRPFWANVGAFAHQI